MKGTRGIGWLLGALLLVKLVAAPALAARVEGLYNAQLLVAEQSIRVDPALASQALEQVVVKVTGRRDLLASPRLRQQMADPLRLIQQFSYQSTTRPMATADGREVLAQRLNIDFNPQLIDRMLADAGIRPLGATRPGVLVWIIEERQGGREYLGRSEDPVFDAMLTRARERGLPIFRPLMDLEDEQALPVGDAWGFFGDSILRASQRYQADSVLVGRVYRDGGWKSEWLLLRGGDSFSFVGQGDSLSAHLASAVDLTADQLFADFVAPVGLTESGVTLRVEGVRGLDDYFRVVDYLRDQAAVLRVNIRGVAGEVLTLNLEIDGSLSQLQAVIGLNNRFQPGLEAPAAEGAVLNYRWVR